jgi:hypothetical protein
MEMKAKKRQEPTDLVFASASDKTLARQLQRKATEGELRRLAPSIYMPATISQEEAASLVRRNWQKIAAKVAPNAVVSHKSAIKSGIHEEGIITLSHPTIYNKQIRFPGLRFVMIKGPSILQGDMRLPEHALFWASRPRAILENLGKNSISRMRRNEIEDLLIDVLNASGEDKLNEIRDSAKLLAPLMGMEKELATLQTLIGALLGTHAHGKLKTKQGQLVALGKPVDKIQQERMEILAAYLRTASLPAINDIAPNGMAKVHSAFIESYFSNYVEGTKFDIHEAEEIVLRDKIVPSRPKDSHDVLGVFHLALNSPTRNAPPPPGEEFLISLKQWHEHMLRQRPEANPGELKSQVNYAGTTKFVEPAMVRGTFEVCSAIALSVPEGLARAIYYGFLISDIHPFEDGNGRISRLMMNAELSRVGLCRVIIPTLFHLQYVDCAKQLTRHNDPAGYVKSIALMAQWTAQFNYADLPKLILDLTKTNALEESPIQFRLLNADGSDTT